MNDPDPIVKQAHRWLQFSEEDLYVAQRLLAVDPPAPRHVCWLSQQAAEKALKAALTLEEIEFSFTHDLDALRNLLPHSWNVQTSHADLAELTEWATETRYPGDWPEPDGADAVRAEAEARAVHYSIASEFRRRSV